MAIAQPPFDPEDFPFPQHRGLCEFCGHDRGRIVEKNGQDTVRCRACDRHRYNAPRTETGREQRSVSTVHAGIRTAKRARILSRATARCEVCGRRDGILHVGHIISVASGLSFGLTEVELNDDENLLALCEECNLGMGSEPMPLRTAIVVLRARISWRDQHEGKPTT